MGAYLSFVYLFSDPLFISFMFLSKVLSRFAHEPAVDCPPVTSQSQQEIWMTKQNETNAQSLSSQSSLLTASHFFLCFMQQMKLEIALSSSRPQWNKVFENQQPWKQIQIYYPVMTDRHHDILLFFPIQQQIQRAPKWQDIDLFPRTTVHEVIWRHVQKTFRFFLCLFCAGKYTTGS